MERSSRLAETYEWTCVPNSHQSDHRPRAGHELPLVDCTYLTAVHPIVRRGDVTGARAGQETDHNRNILVDPQTANRKFVDVRGDAAEHLFIGDIITPVAFLNVPS